MTDTKPLYLHPWPLSADDRALLVAAKARLNLDFPIQPMPAFVQDEEGWLNLAGDERVLLLREECPMIANHAIVRDPQDPNALNAAMEWVLTDKVDSRASTKESMLAALGLKEIPATQLRYERLGRNLKLNDSGKVPVFQSTEDEVDTGE